MPENVPTARVRAHAKINLVLEVLGRRADGYHEIRSLMVPLALSDQVQVQLSGRGIALEVTGAPELVGPSNLMVQAARAFQEAFGVPAGVHLLLEKRIPIGAGLGGGSSDAAAVLRCLARLCRVADRARIEQLAASLGSDVPYFLGPGAATVSGRGEHVSPTTISPTLWLLLLKPQFRISATEAYRAWSARGGAGHRVSKGLPPLTATGPAIQWPDTLGKQVQVQKCRSAAGVGRLLVNDLQPGCLWGHPELGSALCRLRQVAPLGAQMTGSGPTCFGIFATQVQARHAAGRLATVPSELTILTRTLRSFSPVHLVDAPVAQVRPGVAAWRSPTSRSFRSKKRSSGPT